MLLLVLVVLLLGASLLTLLPAAWLISQAKWLIIRFVVYKTGDNFHVKQSKKEIKKNRLNADAGENLKKVEDSKYSSVF